MKYVFTILALCGLAFSQSAPVIQLDEFDAGHARQVYQEKLRADKAWDDLKDAVFHKYLTNKPEFSHGYNNGTEFDFSKDFRAVVPHVFSNPTWNNCTLATPWVSSGAITAIPMN